jgi:hypothetical protein
MSRKKKVLFISEAAYLNTGYAKYSKEVIPELNKSKKYEIAEFSIYGVVQTQGEKQYLGKIMLICQMVRQ